jgi:hypothetical protein
VVQGFRAVLDAGISVDDPQTRTGMALPVQSGRPLASGPEHPVLAGASVGHALCLVVWPSRTGRSEPIGQLNGATESECLSGVIWVIEDH